ncbi:MAG: CBS domain-containing protein [Chloroflexi bacterium]|nr:CBS domain-containing protein [Chloroflexota bacterium]
MKNELVREWMTADVITVTPDTTLPEADRLIVDNMIRRLPVVKNGKLVGICTYGDIREARPSPATSLSIWELNYLLSQLTIGEIMTTNSITISPEATIGEAARLMLKNQISGLPVVDLHNHLVGIITESDIFRMVVQQWENVEDDVAEPYVRYR